MEQPEREELFLSKLAKERQEELERYRSKEYVLAALNQEERWAQLAANVAWKRYWWEEKERSMKELGTSEDTPTVNTAAASVSKRMVQDRESELAGLRRQGHVRRKMRDPHSTARARKLFSKRKRAYHRFKGGNVLISDRDKRELAMVKQKSQTFVEHLFNAPSRPKRVLNRLSSTQMNNIAAVELHRQARVSKKSTEMKMSSGSPEGSTLFEQREEEDSLSSDKKSTPEGSKLFEQKEEEDSLSSDKKSRTKNNVVKMKVKKSTHNAIPRQIEKFISTEPPGGAFPESAFIGTDADEATPTASPLPARKAMLKVDKDTPKQAALSLNTHGELDCVQVSKQVIRDDISKEVSKHLECPDLHTQTAAESGNRVTEDHHTENNTDEQANRQSPAESVRSVQTDSAATTPEEFAEEDAEEAASCSSSRQVSSHTHLYCAYSSTDLELSAQSSSEESRTSSVYYRQVMSSSQKSIYAESGSTVSIHSSITEQSSSEFSTSDTPLLISQVTSPPLLDSTEVHPLSYSPDLMSVQSSGAQSMATLSCYSVSFIQEAEKSRSREIPPPKEAMSNPGFLAYLERRGLQHPTQEDYAIYKLGIFAEDIEEKRREEIEQFMQEMIIRAMKEQLTYANFLKVIHQLAKLAEDIHEKAFLIGVFGRNLSWKLPNFQEMIQEFTVQAMQDIATDFLTLLPVMNISGGDDPETELHDEGWREEWERYQDSDDESRHISQLLDSNYNMPLEEPATSQQSPPHSATTNGMDPIRPGSQAGSAPGGQPSAVITDLQRGVSSTASPCRQHTFLRRSKSAEVLLRTSPVKVTRGGGGGGGGEGHDMTDTPNHSRDIPTSKPIIHHKNSRPANQQRKSSLQEVANVVVPYIPAATVVIQVGVYVAMKLTN